MRPADRLVLVVELVCGLAITIYALVLGFSTGLPVLFVLAALAAAGGPKGKLPTGGSYGDKCAD